MVQKRALSTGEIAEYCGVNFRTVIRWIEQGFLKAYRLPGPSDYRIQVEDFLDFLRAQNMPIPKALGQNSQRVLIVDDDLSMAKAIQRLLKRNGFDTTIADNGFRAGIMLGELLPYLVILDLKMPDISGHDVIKLIRSSKNLSSIKILVISAMPAKELYTALEEGADDILQKPFDNEELLKKISKLQGVSLESRS